MPVRGGSDPPPWVAWFVAPVPPALLPLRPTWRGRLHTWAFLGSVPLGLALVLAARSSRAVLAAAIFAVSLSAVFGTSATYHRLARSPRARLVWGRLDHSMIYVLIAGSYTPLCLLGLPSQWSTPLLAGVWSGAALGILLKASGRRRLAPVANALYVVLGWAGVAALPAVLAHVSLTATLLLVGGGLAYTVGVVIFSTHRPDPSPRVFGYHEVWHACTILGAAAHTLVVWTLVLS